MHLTIEIEYILDNIDLLRAKRILSEYSHYMKYRNTHFPCMSIKEIFEEFDTNEEELNYLQNLREKYGFESLENLI